MLRHEFRTRCCAFRTSVLVATLLVIGTVANAPRATAGESAEGRGIQPLSAAPITVGPTGLAEFEHRMQETCAKVLPSVVAIFNKNNGGQVGCGTIISPDGLVLTHGTGPIGKKRIGMTFNIKLGDGRTTTASYLGVDRAYCMSLMRLDGKGLWPAVRLGDPKELTAGTPCLAIGYPAKRFKGDQPPLVRLTRITGLSPTEITTPIAWTNSDSGAPLFDLDGKLVGFCHGTDSYIRADLYPRIRNDLISGRFVLKSALPDPYDTSHLADWATLVQRTVVRVMCDGEQVALGLVISSDGNVITKSSALVGDNIVCEVSDGRKLPASRLASSWEHDVALLDVAAEGLPVAQWSAHPPKVATIIATIGADPFPLSVGTVGSDVIRVPRDVGQLGFTVSRAIDGIDGVVVRDVLFALTDQVLKVGDVVTEFDGQHVRDLDDFRRQQDRVFASDGAIAGMTISASIRRGKQMRKVALPVESTSEGDRGRPVGDKFAPVAHVDLQGRHTGFPAVFVHDALVRRPRQADVFTPPVARVDLGSPVVDTSGAIVGLNIGSHAGRFTYAIPSDALREAVQGLVEQSRENLAH